MQRGLIGILIFLSLIFSVCEGISQDFNKKLIVSFSDNQPEINKRVLKRIERTYSDSLQLANSLNGFQNYLFDLGYISSNLDEIQYIGDSVLAVFFVGKTYSWAKISVDSSELVFLKSVGIDISKIESEKVLIKDWVDLQTEILDLYANNGYPFTRIGLKNIQIDGSTISGELNIQPFEFYKLDEIILNEEAKLSKKYLQKFLQLQKGMAYDEKKVSELDSKLQELNFVNVGRGTDVEFSEKDFDIYLYIEKKKANTFNGILGVLPDDKTGKILITGDISLSLVNSLHHGDYINLKWQRLQVETQKLDLEFSYPYIFNTNAGIDFDFSLYKQDSTFLNIETALGVNYQLRNDAYIKLFGEIKSSSTIAEQINDNYSNTNTYLGGVSFEKQKLDFKPNPQKGYYLNWVVSMGKRNVEIPVSIDTLGFDFDDELTQVESKLDAGIYFNPFKRWVIHLGTSSRWMQSYADKNKDVVYFSNEMFRFGGMNTLKGFDEELFIAKFYATIDFQIRYHFEKRSAFYVFWNGAFYENIINLEYYKDMPLGFGIGLEFDTKGGAFLINYALGSQNDNPFTLRNGKVHFGYVARF